MHASSEGSLAELNRSYFRERTRDIGLHGAWSQLPTHSTPLRVPQRLRDAEIGSAVTEPRPTARQRGVGGGSGTSSVRAEPLFFLLRVASVDCQSMALSHSHSRMHA